MLRKGKARRKREGERDKETKNKIPKLIAYLDNEKIAELTSTSYFLHRAYLSWLHAP